jgi:hypothetical protein
MLKSEPPFLQLHVHFAYIKPEHLWPSRLNTHDVTNWLSNLVTRSKEHISSLKVTCTQPAKKLPNINYLIHKSLSLVPILSHMNSMHTLPFHLFNIHFNITLPSVLRHPKLSRSFRIHNPKLICIFFACHIFHPSDCHRFY